MKKLFGLYLLICSIAIWSRSTEANYYIDPVETKGGARQHFKSVNQPMSMAAEIATIEQAESSQGRPSRINDERLPIEEYSFTWFVNNQGWNLSGYLTGTYPEGTVVGPYEPRQTMENDKPYTITGFMPAWWNATVDTVCLYDGENPENSQDSTKIYVIYKNAPYTEVYIGTFNQHWTTYQKWVKFPVPNPQATLAVIVRNTYKSPWITTVPGHGRFYGSGIKLIGDRDNAAPPSAQPNQAVFRDMKGTNGHQYEWIVSDIQGAPSYVEVPHKTVRFDEMGLRTYRSYIFWADMMPAEDVFAPEISPAGTHVDSLLAAHKRHGIDALVSLAGGPRAGFQTFPDKIGYEEVKHQPGHGYQPGDVVGKRWDKDKLNLDIDPNTGQPYNVPGYWKWRKVNCSVVADSAYLEGVVLKVIDDSTFLVGEAGSYFPNTIGLSAGTTYYVAMTNSGINYTATQVTTNKIFWKPSEFPYLNIPVMQVTDDGTKIRILCSQHHNQIGGNPEFVWAINSYADSARREMPTSYSRASKGFYWFTDRYGSVSTNNPALRPPVLYDDDFDWTPPAAHKAGLGYIKYIQPLNEPDATWRGKYNYYDGNVLAAYLSAVYDGDMGRLGPGHGVKQADPNVKVVLSAQSIPSVNCLMMMWNWCRIHRGLNPDGTVNLPFDIIDFHNYNTDAPGAEQYNPSNTTTGLPPHMGYIYEYMKRFVAWARVYAPGMPVWLSEFGYDRNPLSIYQAPAYGGYTSGEVGASWGLRTMIMGMAAGLARMMWYNTVDEVQNSPMFFASAGLLHVDSAGFKAGTNPPPWRYPKRELAQMMEQMKPYDGFRYHATIREDSIFCYQLVKGDSSIFIQWGAETAKDTIVTKFNPACCTKPVATKTFQERKGSFQLTLFGVDTITVKRFVWGSSSMSAVNVAIGGVYQADYGTIPYVIEAFKSPENVVDPPLPPAPAPKIKTQYFIYKPTF